MFNELNRSSLIQKVSESRLNDLSSYDAVLADITGNHDFGKGLFHKILNKGILKPNNTPTSKEEAGL